MSEAGDSRCEVCGAAAAHRCSRCKQAAYCCQEHQRQDWKQHKELCKAYQVESNPELGRYLVAVRDFQAGDIVLREAPLVIGPRHHSQHQERDRGVCLMCYQPLQLDTEFRCPRCLWPVCGPDCHADSKVHAAECTILQSVPRKKLQEIMLHHEYHYEAITPLRCLVLQKKSPSKWQQVLNMESHKDKRCPGTDAYKEASDIADYLHSRYLEGAGAKLLQDCSKKMLHHIHGVLDVNGLDVSSPTGAELVALYPTVCLMEHSCIPNTRHSFEMLPGPYQYRITISAARHIAKGEHISTMYTHALWGTQARQEHLRVTKYFSCCCRRCADPTELGTHLSSIKCLAPRSLTDNDSTTCGGIQLPVCPLDEQTEWCCNSCPMSLTSVQVSDLVTRIGDEVESILQGGPTVKQLEDLLSKLGTFLHPHHYHCYSVKHSLVQLYGHQHGYLPHQLSDELLQKKSDMCRELLGTTEMLDPGNARLALYSSVLQYELHRAITQQVRLQLAKHPPVISMQEATQLAMEARVLLQRAVRTLQPEPEMSPGHRMLELITKSLQELNSWIKQELH